MTPIMPMQKVSPLSTRVDELGARDLWLRSRMLNWEIECREVPK